MYIARLPSKILTIEMCNMVFGIASIVLLGNQPHGDATYIGTSKARALMGKESHLMVNLMTPFIVHSQVKEKCTCMRYNGLRRKHTSTLALQLLTQLGFHIYLIRPSLPHLLCQVDVKIKQSTNYALEFTNPLTRKTYIDRNIKIRKMRRLQMAKFEISKDATKQ